MCIAESGEIDFPLSSELLWRRFDRKLGSLVLDAGVEFGQSRDEIIQRRPEVAADLSDKYANLVGDRNVLKDLPFSDDACLAWRNAEVQLLEDGGLGLCDDERFMKDFKLIEMFACPIYESESAI
jgi:hypothetical protein